MKLIVGLGNPGLEYANTRHNVGFMIMDALAKQYGFEYSKNKFQGLYGEAIIDSEKVLFLKPQKYMNLSGEVISAFVNFFKIPLTDVLIFVDDLNLPCGKIRVKQKGSSGGHNGLKDIERCLGTEEYSRVKIGISNNKDIDTKDYVLGKFNSSDLEIIQHSVNISCNICKDFLKNKQGKEVEHGFVNIPGRNSSI